MLCEGRGRCRREWCEGEGGGDGFVLLSSVDRREGVGGGSVAVGAAN